MVSIRDFVLILTNRPKNERTVSDYIARGQLEFRENSMAFRLTFTENRLGLNEKSLITSDAA
jgi:hypothetical protein